MEYEKAYKLKNELLKENDGKSLDEVINGEIIQTSRGSCYSITEKSKIKLNTLSSNKAKNKLLSDLKLLSGIGEARERKLNDEGYKTIEDLCDHHKFGDEASCYLNLINNQNITEITNWIENWYPKSHPLILCLSSFCDHENFIFLDIETLGFFNKPIILLGMATISKNNITVNQYLARNKDEEEAVLDAFIQEISNEDVFVTFNGQTFDIPYIKNRLNSFKLNMMKDHPHYDLLHYSRRLWSDDLDNCKLTTLEKHLFDIEREDDIPSGLVPVFYETYTKTGNNGPLIPIITHNKQDIITLALIFSTLHNALD